MSLRQRFGERIRSLRLERRQTQEEFWCDVLGMTVDFGSLVERGINAPSFETIETICSSLGMSESQLFAFPVEIDGAENRGRVKKTATEKRRGTPKKGGNI
jgi:transcriptional regulator with XRE-family HTH domain